MAKDKDKHPSWFKMKLERRELVRQLSPETAVNVLLACWDFLETGEKPVSHRKRCVLCVHAGHGRSLGAISDPRSFWGTGRAAQIQ